MCIRDSNHILDTNLPVECGINRALIRSTTAAGKVTLTAQAKGLLSASLTLETVSYTHLDVYKRQLCRSPQRDIS